MSNYDIHTDLEALRQRAEALEHPLSEELEKAIHDLAVEWLAVDSDDTDAE